MDPDINEYKTDIVTWLKVITVHSVKCKIRELPDERNARWVTVSSGKRPLRNCPSGNWSVGGLSAG